MSPSIIVAAAVGFFIGAVLVWIIKNTNQKATPCARSTKR